jgi:hypothetical protein
MKVEELKRAVELIKSYEGENYSDLVKLIKASNNPYDLGVQYARGACFAAYSIDMENDLSVIYGAKKEYSNDVLLSAYGLVFGMAFKYIKEGHK